MKRIALMFLIPAMVAFGQKESAPSYRVEIVPDRSDHRYETGETITFEIRAVNEEVKDRLLDFGSVEFSVTDGRKPIESDILAMTGKPLRLTAEATRPGFVMCEAAFIGPASKTRVKRAVVAVSPEQIGPSREVPVDFAAFWDEQKARLSQVESKAEMQQVDSPQPAVEAFDLRVACGEEVRPVSGYLARPANAKPKSLPVVLWVHGAGVRGASLAQAVVGAEAGFLSLDINAHGIENGQPAEYYKELSGEDGFLKAYTMQGRENRDGFYFRGMFLRLVRAIDFLTAQPEWDGQTVAVVGHSQGGAQAIVAGGLDERVTFIGAGVPAMCDHTGMLRKRHPGWPRMVPIYPDTGKPDPQIAEVSRYFDAVNFAARYHGEAIFSVGFIDTVCPPSSVYAAYNQLRGEKRMLNEPVMGHAAPVEIKTQFLKALKAHASKNQGEEPRSPR